MFVVLLPNWARLKAYLSRLSPLDTTISELYFERIGLMTRDVMLGTVGVSLIQTIIMWLVFALLNIPFAGVLALFVFFFALIPFLGISLITIPFSVILIAQGQWFGAIVILLVHLIIINNIELVLRPLITSKALKLHPALVILGIIGGLITYGLAGLFAGPIIVVVLTTSLEVFTNNYGQELNPTPEQA